MNHPTAPTEVHGFFRVGGLSASINVMRTAVQGEALWKSVPNNTVIMIAFAACLALRLSNTHPETNPAIAQSVRSLVQQTADVFERVGSTPPHRQGASILYALHLRAMVARYHPGSPPPVTAKAVDTVPALIRNWPQSNEPLTQAQHMASQSQPLFAQMTDLEFSEALKSVESELFASEANISADWWNNLDWLTWDDRIGDQDMLR